VATAAAQALGLDKSPALKGVGFSPSMNPPEKNGALAPEGKTLTGIDVLESTHFAALEGLHHIAVLTNQNGLDSQGKRTIDILASLTANNQQLTTIFTPEHGLSGVMDQSKVASTTDPTTHLTVISLYGPTQRARCCRY
jgi:uncharacterized protein YbbC (DUF1343 family)